MKKLFLFLLLVISSAALTLGGLFAWNTLAVPKPEPVIKKDTEKPAVVMVSLVENKAEPDLVTIRIGSYVQFNSKDGKTHILSQGSGNAYETDHEHEASGLESGRFGADEAWKVQITEPGVYNFHDHDNPDIYITVIATDPKQKK